MTHGSLFSGIGGFDLAAQWMGWHNAFHVEQNEFCRAVLAHHFPNSNSHEDIKTFNAAQYYGQIDIITGGFPCQPFSVAGKRAGTDDTRWLWPEMFAAIRAIQPWWVVAENVRGLINMSGMAFNTVCADLENEGFQVWPFVLPAAAVNAPHKRERVFIVASHTHRKKCKRWGSVGQCERQTAKQRGHRIQCAAARFGTQSDAAHTHRHGLEGGIQPGRHGSAPSTAQPAAECVPPDTQPEPIGWETFPTVTPVCGRNDGLPTGLDGITFSKWRKETVKAYGNAVVPQVALNIFRAIAEHDAIR